MLQSSVLILAAAAGDESVIVTRWYRVFRIFSIAVQYDLMQDEVQ
jgi:hypothetical protein